MNSTPIAVFDAASDALVRSDWRAAAALCDPASLTLFMRQMIDQIAPAQPVKPITAEFLLRNDPSMPREVAEYQAAQMAKHRDPVQNLERELPGVADVAALRDMNPEDVFAAWLRGRSPEYQYEQAVRSGHMPAEILAHFREQPPPTPVKQVALGYVMRGGKIAHVVFDTDYPESEANEDEDDFTRQYQARLSPEERELVRDTAFSHAMITNCRLQPNGEWRLIADHSFLGVGNFAIGYGWVDGDDEGGAKEA